MTSKSREMQVGVLFFVALALMLVVTIFIGDFRPFQETFFVEVEFKNASGLRKGDKIRYSGVEVGQVKEIRVKNRYVVAILEIRDENDIEIDRAADIRIVPTTPLGGNHIQITPPKTDTEPILKDGTARLKGTPHPDLTERIGKAVDQISEAMEEVNKGKSPLGILTQDEESGEDLKVTLQKFREGAEDFQETLEKINEGKGALGAMVDDEETRDNLKESIRRLKNITKKIDEGEGLLGKVVSDEEFAEKSEQLIDDLRKPFRIRTIIGASSRSVPEHDFSIHKVYLRIEPTDDKFYHIGASLFDIDRESPLATEKRIRKLNRNDDDPIVTIDVLLGWRFFDRQVSLGVGLLEGKPGGTLELAPKFARAENTFLQNWRLRAEGRDSYDDREIHEDYNPFLLRSSLRVDVKPWENVPPLILEGGMDNLLDDPEYFFGIGIEIDDKDLKYLVGTLGAAF